ncbi:MAG: hypothetical protein ACREO1_00225, partial [Arenimonas sp.]
MSLRINDIKLPLDHSEADLSKAVADALGIAASDLSDISVYKRAYDARKKSAICLIYNVDVSLSGDLEKK